MPKSDKTKSDWKFGQVIKTQRGTRQYFYIDIEGALISMQTGIKFLTCIIFTQNFSFKTRRAGI
jgi:hypothetical protein